MKDTNKCNQQGCEIEPVVKFNHLGFDPVKYCTKHYQKYCVIMQALVTPLPLTKALNTSEET